MMSASTNPSSELLEWFHANVVSVSLTMTTLTTTRRSTMMEPVDLRTKNSLFAGKRGNNLSQSLGKYLLFDLGRVLIHIDIEGMFCTLGVKHLGRLTLASAQSKGVEELVAKTLGRRTKEL